MIAVNTAGANGAMAIADPGSKPPTVLELLLVYQLKCLKGLDVLVKTEMDSMKAGNEKATKLNEALKAVNTLIDKFGAENDPNKKRTLNDGEKQALETALRGAGIDPDAFFGPCYSENEAWNATRVIHLRGWNPVELPARPVGGDNVSLSDYRTGAATIKGQIETNGSNQSMASLTLQETMGKRNQLSEIVSATVEKTGEATRDVIRKTP